VDLTQALERLRTVGDGPITESHRDAAGTAARAVVDAVKDGTRRQVGGTTYRVVEITWPVSRFPDGSSAYACPRQVVSLTRDDAVLLDVRSDYWDGQTTYPAVGEKVGRWRRFRMGAPGERGWDLHLATEEDLIAFAAEAEEMLNAFGIPGADLTTPAD
jgi:hypothetical protein